MAPAGRNDGDLEDFETLDDYPVAGKTVLARVDLNSPVDKGKVSLSDRIKEHGRTTLRELAEGNARTVVLAHQGRPGHEDFIGLEQHAKLLEPFVGRPVSTVDDVAGPLARAVIRELQPGEVLLLGNVRAVPDETAERTPEEHSRGLLVKALAPLADLFVSDAFSASHRSHASVVGFTAALPSVAGRVMERELRALDRVSRGPEEPVVYLLGGAKPADSFRVMRHVLSAGRGGALPAGGTAGNAILACGMVGNIFLLARHGGLGPFASYRDDVDALNGKVQVPSDLAVAEGARRREIPASEISPGNWPLDIGPETVERYRAALSRARTIIANGPPGKYEAEAFSQGTRALFQAVSESRGFTVIGGGDTLAALDALGIPRERFSCVSLGGHALLDYLAGIPLPGVEALRRLPASRRRRPEVAYA